MQRKIAEELKLDHETMAMFDKQDEEDDFDGVYHGLRDVIRSVSEVIAQTLWNKRVMVIFLNGYNDGVDINRFGISPDYRDHVIVWSFKKQTLTIDDRYNKEMSSKLVRYTHLFLGNYINAKPSMLSSSQFSTMLREEAASIAARHPCMRDIDLTMVTQCCLYELFLHYSFHKATGFVWVDHASNYWMCDGIIKEDIPREVCNILHQEIRWDCDGSLLDGVFEKLMKDPETPFLVVNKDYAVYEKRPYRWISIASKNLTVYEAMEAVLKMTTSLFVSFERSNNMQGLANGFLKHCSNLSVLILSCCAFSFVSPPFLQCHGLRFLGLDHCTHDNTSAGENNTAWTCLRSLLVLDIRYTDWDEILSEENMDVMANLRGLNIEGVYCWNYTGSRLQGRLPYLQSLRIIKPLHQTKTLTDSDNSFVGKTKLEILDLSGNRDMKTIPTSLSMATSLKTLILDGCHGLENVTVPDGFPSSLGSFKFYGYNSELEHLFDADTRVAKTSKISLQGCTRLKHLLLHKLPNLVELDLSGTAIKVLRLENVPGLKRLLLLNCEHLRAIKSRGSRLELLCIDTRPARRAHGYCRPSLTQHKSFGVQLHAILADARLVRSLWPQVYLHKRQIDQGGVYFNIHITASSELCGGVKLESSNNQQRHVDHVVTRHYADARLKISNALLLPLPQPPTQCLDRRIEISDGSRGLESEIADSYTSLGQLMREFAESLHVHDASTITSMPGRDWSSLK
ncbi:unnamed protein product [Urochloa humidicola]